MGNRNQYQPDWRRSSRSQGNYGRQPNRFQDDDENRYSSSEGDDYARQGSYEDTGNRIKNFSGYGSVGQDEHGQSLYRGNTYQERSAQGRFGQPGREYGSSGTSDYGRSGWSEPYGEGRQYGNRDWQNEQSSYRSQGSQGYQGAQGQHRGKGPKGYQRSDDRIKELICERLSDDPEIDASDITVSVQGGKVTLEGSVDSRRTKNAAEDIAEQFGSQEVQNNLRVSRQNDRQFGSSGQSGMGASASNGDHSSRQKSK
jgi:osmotically-inducible protein OsmY